MVTVEAYTTCENTSGLEYRPEILSSVMLTETHIQTARVKLSLSSLDGKALTSNAGLQDNLDRASHEGHNNNGGNNSDRNSDKNNHSNSNTEKTQTHVIANARGM